MSMGRGMRAGVAGVLCSMGCLATVTVMFPRRGNSDGGVGRSDLEQRISQLHSSKLGALDRRLHKILEAEHTV